MNQHTRHEHEWYLAEDEDLFGLWQEFRKIVERVATPPTIELLRHGFYSGAMACFLLLVRRADDGETVDEAVARIEALRIEIDAFKHDIKAAPPW